MMSADERDGRYAPFKSSRLNYFIPAGTGIRDGLPRGGRKVYSGWRINMSDVDPQVPVATRSSPSTTTKRTKSAVLRRDQNSTVQRRRCRRQRRGAGRGGGGLCYLYKYTAHGRTSHLIKVNNNRRVPSRHLPLQQRRRADAKMMTKRRANKRLTLMDCCSILKCSSLLVAAAAAAVVADFRRCCCCCSSHCCRCCRCCRANGVRFTLAFDVVHMSHCEPDSSSPKPFHSIYYRFCRRRRRCCCCRSYLPV